MNAKRKRQLDQQYQKSVLGTSQETATHLYNKYLKIFHDERDERNRSSYYIFLAIRKQSRDNGYRADDDLINSRIDKRLYAHRLKKYCADVYAKQLNRYELADIDIESAKWSRLIRGVTVECIKAFDGIDPDDKDAVCIAMARTWNRFIQIVHKNYRLPSVLEMKKHLRGETEIERNIIDVNNFETQLTRRERLSLEAEIA